MVKKGKRNSIPKYSIRTRKQCETRRWSGGTTTDLYIFPKSSSYEKRNFHFRLSVATVEMETASFTPLEGIQRTTLVIDGETELTHKDKYSTKLNRFESDQYEGEWETSSVGKSTNFNLMTRGKASGTLEGRFLELDEQMICSATQNFVLYVHRGQVAFILNHQVNTLQEGDVFIAEEEIPVLILKALEESVISCCTIEA